MYEESIVTVLARLNPLSESWLGTKRRFRCLKQYKEVSKSQQALQDGSYSVTQVSAGENNDGGGSATLYTITRHFSASTSGGSYRTSVF